MDNNMNDTMNNTPSLQELAQAFATLQAQFTGAQQHISNLQNELSATQNELGATKNELGATKNALIATQGQTLTAKPKPPEAFKGKDSIKSWATHMSNYLGNSPPDQALWIAISYLQGPAHEWWIVFRETDEGAQIRTWESLRTALIARFDTLNKEKIARDKLAKWKQLKDVATFNDDFQRIILDIPNISVEEQIDRYTRGLKSYIWKELCTRDYTKLADAMKDAERVESAHGRIRSTSIAVRTRSYTAAAMPEPMDLGNIRLKKLTAEERQVFMKQGRCLRCRGKAHMAKNCPEGQRS